MLEKMDAFFEARLSGYDAHMLRNIAGAAEFYPFTASCLPAAKGAAVLDLGCGTGLELQWFFSINPTAAVTGIDLSSGMLSSLKKKFPKQNLTLVCGSYFDLPFHPQAYDAAVSVESLHHFTKEEKIPLYTKLAAALKNQGYFILTDYFALSDEEEHLHQQELQRLKQENGISDGGFYHYDTPLTVAHETEAFLSAGFAKVEILKSWGATYTIRASKPAAALHAVK